MPASGRTIVVAGAGIAGLTLALGLAQRGVTVIVLERGDVVPEVGAGLQISPNARFVLDGLGLSDGLARLGLEPLALDTYAQGGTRPLVSLELGPLMRERFGSAYTVMHRADLADLLYKACRRCANIDILFGVRDWDVVSHARGVTVAIDEANGMSRTQRADAFVGADGVHSRTRREILDGPPARFGQRIAWRRLLPLASLDSAIARDRVSVFFGAGFHLVCYPLPHRDQANLALFLPSRTAEPTTMPKPVRPGPLVTRILDADGPAWTPWPLYTVATDIWHQGNIGLIGDAAHAMVPFQAQGAAMAIEDAAVLAPLLAENQSPAEAFAAYAAVRKDRVQRVAQLSAQNGRIFHLPWPLSAGRNRVMALGGPRAHLRRLGWVYSHRAGETVPD